MRGRDKEAGRQKDRARDTVREKEGYIWKLREFRNK